ncbi:MAG: exodeoxyribonuclease III, partial [Thermoanaerobaculia bacterium]
LCPGPLDTWDEAGHRGRIFHTDEERERFGRLVAGGLVDLYRRRHPEGHAFSWWDYRAGAFHQNQGLRIDLLLGTRPVAERLREVEIDRDYRKKKEGLIPSDHAPVVAELS